MGKTPRSFITSNMDPDRMQARLNLIRGFRSFLGLWMPLAALVSAAAQTPSFSETPLFISGQGGYNTYRIPAIVRGTDRTLLAFCEGRKSSAGDSGDIDIVMRRSTDGGQSWGPMVLVQEEGNSEAIAIGNPAPVVDEATGNIFLFFCRNNDRVFYAVSSDQGATWSSRTEVTSTVKLATWGWYATGPGHGIRLKRGAQAGRLIISCYHRMGIGGLDSGAPGTHAIYSDDHGASWHLGAVAEVTPEVYPSENQCLELVAPATGGGSKLYFNARKLGSAGSAPGERFDTISNDGGLTYSAAYAPRLDLVCPLFNGGVEGSLQRLHATDEGSATNRILFSCPNDPAYRVRLSVWSSTNEAASWSAPKAVYDGPSAYSDMSITRSGEIGLLYEKGVVSPYETVTFARFNEAWLDTSGTPSPVFAANPKSAFWNFEEKLPGQLADTSAGAIHDIQTPGYNHNLTASKSFPYVRGSANYGSGTALAFDGTGGVLLSDAASSDHFDFAATSSFTLEAVFRIPAGSTQIGALMAKDLGGGLPSWWLRVNGGKLQFLVSDYGHQTILNPANLVNDGQWHHVAAIRDAANPASKILRLYLDSLLIGSTADITTGSLGNSESFNIGCFGNDTTRNLTGDIDMVRISPAALTTADFVKPYSQFEVQIAVAQASALTDGAGNVDFGTVNVGSGRVTKTFTISNPGVLDLTSLAVSINGTNAADFSVGALSRTSIPAGAAPATFTVTFSPSAGSSSRTAAIHIASNVTGTRNPFDITLVGTVNVPPTDVALSTASIVERVPPNTAVGRFISSDPNGSDTFSYSLVAGQYSDDNADFTITGDVLKIKNPPVLAAKSSYSIRVRTTDSGGLFYEKPFTITVKPGGLSFTDCAVSLGLSGADASMTAMPFNDGVQNLLKYAFNMNLQGPDVSVLAAGGTAGLPRVTLDSSGAQPVLRIEFLRRLGVGLIYTAQRAATLPNFEPMSGTETVTPIDGEWERVRIDSPFQAATEPRGFVRIQVTQP